MPSLVFVRTGDACEHILSRVVHALLQGSCSLRAVDAAVCSCDPRSAVSLWVEECGRVQRGEIVVVESVRARFLV